MATLMYYTFSTIPEPSQQQPNKGIFIKLHETLTDIENLLEIGSFNGSIKHYFAVIEECAADRPESSILRLIGHLSQSIVPTEHLWLTNLYNLLDKYFKPNIRTNIRLKVLDVLAHVVKLNRLVMTKLSNGYDQLTLTDMQNNR